MKAPHTQDTLEHKARRWQKALADAATGPLIVAAEIVTLSENWAGYRGEAGGRDCTTWLRDTLGRGKSLAWFTQRHNAVEALGEASRRMMHHEVAVWVSRNVPPEFYAPVKFMLRREQRENGGNPLTLRQAKPRILRVMGATAAPNAKQCGRCKELEAQLRAAGIEPAG